MTNPAIAAIHATLERRRHPMLARASTASSPHTQWCCQEIGEISSAARPLRARAKQSSPAANAFRMARLATTRTTAESSSHRPVPAGVSPRSRSATAASTSRRSRSRRFSSRSAASPPTVRPSPVHRPGPGNRPLDHHGPQRHGPRLRSPRRRTNGRGNPPPGPPLPPPGTSIPPPAAVTTTPRPSPSPVPSSTGRRPVPGARQAMSAGLYPVSTGSRSSLR
jgi:hypothetical protein